jgi:hypothetical protein
VSHELFLRVFAARSTPPKKVARPRRLLGSLMRPSPSPPLFFHTTHSKHRAAYEGCPRRSALPCAPCATALSYKRRRWARLADRPKNGPRHDRPRVEDSSVVNVGLPAIATNLSARGGDLSWAVNGYPLPLSALLLIGVVGGRCFWPSRTAHSGRGNVHHRFCRVPPRLPACQCSSLDGVAGDRRGDPDGKQLGDLGRRLQ